MSSSLDTLLKLSKTTSPQKLFAYDCVTLYDTYLLGYYRIEKGPFYLYLFIYIFFFLFTFHGGKFYSYFGWKSVFFFWIYCFLTDRCVYFPLPRFWMVGEKYIGKKVKLRRNIYIKILFGKVYVFLFSFISFLLAL